MMNTSRALESRERALVLPELRSMLIEPLDRDFWDRVFYFKRRYLDDRLLGDGVPFQQSSVWRVCWWLVRRRPELVQLPEPLWLREWPRTMLMLLALRTGSAVSRRPRSRVGFVAIENADPAQLSERLPRRLRKFGPTLLWLACRAMIPLFDDVVFGTAAAAKAYAQAAGERTLRRVHVAQTTILPDPCPCADDEPAATNVVSYLGAFEARKGVLLLAETWRQHATELADAELFLLGFGPQTAALEELLSGLENVTFVQSPSREDIHLQLRRTHVVMLLSRPDRRWREQIGGSVLEALSHGCRIVTTDQTGLAEWLAEHGHSVVPWDSSPQTIAREIRRQLSMPRGQWKAALDHDREELSGPRYLLR